MSTQTKTTPQAGAGTPTADPGVIDLGTQKIEGESLNRLALRRLRRDYLTLGAMFILIALAIITTFAAQIEDYFDVSYRTTSAEEKLLPIGADGHPLGTDHLGRDHLARLLYGGQVSIRIGIAGGLISTVIGISIGLIAGYYQGGSLGFIDDLIMWFITTLNSIPTLMLLILLGAVLSPTVQTLVLTLTLISWTGTMRLVRGESLAQREREYVLGAKVVGASPWRVMFVHILPNIFSVLIVQLALLTGTLILVEAALSFLGLGVRPPTPSWGNMLTSAQANFRQGAHLSVLPGLLILVTVLCFYLIGDGLRDAYDPQASKKNTL